MCVCVFISLESRVLYTIYASVSRGTHSIGISPKVLLASVRSRLYLLV